MAKKTKIGVIGCGTIATTAHIPAYTANETVEIVYFCDLIPERAQAAADKYGSGKVVIDFHDVINDPEIEGISVCVPNKSHSIISIAALKAGKHVLCEKPAARTYAEALEMQNAQHETGKTLNIGVVNRFNASVNKVRDYIQSGALGDVFHVYVSFRAHRSIPGLGGDFTNHAVAGGGALIDWGVHYLDIVMYCCNDPKPLTVSGQAFSKLGVNMADYTYTDMWAGPPNLDGVYNVDDSVTALVRTEGPVMTVHGAWAQNIGIQESYIDFMGDKGGIRLQYGGNFTVYTAEHGALVEYTPKFEHNNMFQNEIDSFVKNIDSGEKLPSHIDKAVLTSQIMQAIYDSSEAQREIIL